MKKSLIIRIIVFILIFCILFTVVQSVLHHRWLHSNALYEKMIDYEADTDADADVIVFGTSETLASYLPIVTYHEAGITGYNMAVSWKSAVTQYYQLKYALKKHTPKAVVCDFSCLYSEDLPIDKGMNIYDKIIDTMPDRAIKEELIRDVIRLNSEQDYFIVKYPLFKYHNMWTDLKEENFGVEKRYKESYKQYRKGATLNEDTFSGGLVEINEDIWAPREGSEEFSAISIEYYDKFIKECQDKGIKVIAYIPPKINDGGINVRDLPQKLEYFNSRNVECLNYNNYESYLRADLDLEIDYFDIEHLNAPGAVKLSKLIATDLKNVCDFEDRRADKSICDKWDKDWDEFVHDMIRMQSSPYSQLDMSNILGLDANVGISDIGKSSDISFRELRDFANENPGHEYTIDVINKAGNLEYSADWKYEGNGWVDSNSDLVDSKKDLDDLEDLKD